MMLDVNLRYRSGATLFSDMIDPVRVAFRRSVRPPAKEAGQSTTETGKTERKGLQSTKVKQALENSPSCPCCDAMMDGYGYSFAWRMVVDGVVYYCNNPICGGPHDLAIKKDPTTQQSRNTIP